MSAFSVPRFTASSVAERARDLRNAARLPARSLALETALVIHLEYRWADTLTASHVLRRPGAQDVPDDRRLVDAAAVTADDDDGLKGRRILWGFTSTSGAGL